MVQIKIADGQVGKTPLDEVNLLSAAHRLTPLEQLVIRAFLGKIAALQRADCISSLVVFGSRARGDAHDESDLDIAVFCSGQRDRRLVRQVMDAAIDAMFERDAMTVRLRPVVFFSEEQMQGAGLRSNIEQEGIELWRSQ